MGAAEAINRLGLQGMGNGPAVLCTLPRLHVAGPLARAVPPGPVRQVWADHEGRVIATGGREGAAWWMHWPGLATFWFEHAGDVRAEPVREGQLEDIKDIFTRGVTPVVLLARGFEGLHASSILSDGGVVPFVATSGTGKSTIAVAVASSGVTQFADDTVIYRMVAGSPVGVRLPFPVRVDAAVREALRHVKRDGTRGNVPDSAPLHRIYHLVRDHTLDPARPSFLSVPPSRRFELLLAHAHPFDMGSDERRRAFMENLLTAARTVEVWECRFAPDLAALPALAHAIRTHLDG